MCVCVKRDVAFLVAFLAFQKLILSLNAFLLYISYKIDIDIICIVVVVEMIYLFLFFGRYFIFCGAENKNNKNTIKMHKI